MDFNNKNENKSHFTIENEEISSISNLDLSNNKKIQKPKKNNCLKKNQPKS